MTRRQHFVEFFSPGTLFSESTRCPIEEWNPATAAKMAKTVLERYGAKPFGFRFSTDIVSDPVDDGEGGKLAVQGREVARSGMYHLTGTVKMIDEIIAMDDPKNQVLISNMRCNDWPIIVTNNNSWKSTQPFAETDIIVNWDGSIARRGDEPELVSYRKRKIAEHRKELNRNFSVTV